LSNLTIKLLRAKPANRQAYWRGIFGEVCDRLVAAYGRPTLGNYRDPVREILYIVLSAKTTERLYQRAYRGLKRRYRTLSQLAGADVAGIEECIRGAGLANKRAPQIQKLAQKLIEDFGPNPSRNLRKLEPEMAFRYLVGLPGVGPKSAFCVMTMSLDADVFAVDANVQRVAWRLGALPRDLKHYEAQKRLPSLVPIGRSRDLHVSLVIHGRQACLPRTPRCDGCVLLDLCKFGKARMRNQIGS